ncbi:MAG: efflux RND transporter periplasmic adaptor subunit [Bacteroidales bacterium]|jgi:RND family efflux transporter MFP subunit|nr:efflux RND transporter periplasmic adaptor subunit [Bacteroidales bacterium]
MKRTFCLLLTVALTLSLGGCKKKNGQQEEEKIEKVETTVINSERISRIINYSTTLQGYETMNVAPSLTGHIERILVDVGSKVSQGQLLLRMDPTQYNTAKINLDKAKTELDRVEKLYSTGSATQQVYDQTKSGYELAKEQVVFLEANTFVKAQFSGIISAKNLENGEMYAGAVPILVLTQISTLKTLMSMSEIYYPLIKEGMNIDLTSEIYPDQVFKGTVEIVYPTIDPATHSFQLKIKIPNAKQLLRPGMFVTTSMVLGETDAIVVPYNSVMKLIGSNDRYVFLNENGVAKRVVVQLGQRFDDKIEISGEGITAGIELITAGQARLIDSVKLDVVKKR